MAGAEPEAALVAAVPMGVACTMTGVRVSGRQRRSSLGEALELSDNVPGRRCRRSSCRMWMKLSLFLSNDVGYSLSDRIVDARRKLRIQATVRLGKVWTMAASQRGCPFDALSGSEIIVLKIPSIAPRMRK